MRDNFAKCFSSGILGVTRRTRCCFHSRPWCWRYDIFMNNYTERTWTLVTINAAIKDLMKTYGCLIRRSVPQLAS
jgi:hypothetical protein